MREITARDASSHLRRMARVRRVYRLWAPGYDAFRRVWSRWTLRVEHELDRLFAERIRPGDRVLELAPGTGVNVERLRRRAPDFGRYVGVDASEPMLARARSKADGDARIELRNGDVTRSEDLPAGPFDFVVSTWLLSHLEDPRGVVLDALRRLAPGGTAVFVFSTPPSRRCLRALLAPIYRLGGARFVDPAQLEAIAGLEELHRAAGGLATLAVFRSRPGESRRSSEAGPPG